MNTNQTINKDMQHEGRAIIESNNESIGQSPIEISSSTNAVTGEASASALLISAAVEGQNPTIEGVVNTIEELERIIEGLSSYVNSFRL